MANPKKQRPLHYLQKRVTNNRFLCFQVLVQARKHSHIVHLCETIALSIKWSNKLTHFMIFEPLGKDLQILITETSKTGGFLLDVIKKVAKHVLLALKTLHGFEIDGHKFIHSDIKPCNIAACMSQKDVHDQLKDLIKSRPSLQSFRMACKQKSWIFKRKLNEEKVWKALSECTEAPQIEEESSDLKFKLIDFGNVLVNFNNLYFSI